MINLSTTYKVVKSNPFHSESHLCLDCAWVLATKKGNFNNTRRHFFGQ